MASNKNLPLRGTRIAITRPAGHGVALARSVRKLGGTPLSLPGSSLRTVGDAQATRATLRMALACDIAIFTSPATVRFARALAPLRTRARVVAPGTGTLRALRRAGIADAIAPSREDSEGILALPLLADVRGKRVGIIGAPGGRGLLARALAARGADMVHADVYRRVPARLDRRHVDALLRHAHMPLFVPLSSSEALANILAVLPPDARTVLLGGVAVASSARLATAARRAGFTQILRAASAHPGALLATVIEHRG